MVDNGDIVIIPARGGSKRLPRKNLMPCGDLSLLEISIKFAQSLEFVGSIIVSTDCEQTAQVAQAAGIEVPWLRPPELARDDTPSWKVVLHALNTRGVDLAEETSNVIMLQPTSPFRNKAHIIEARRLLQGNKDADSVVSVAPAHHHPGWCFRVKGDFMSPYDESCAPNLRSQDLEQVYCLNGNFYIANIKQFIASKSFVGAKTIPFIQTNPLLSLDIDTQDELNMCNWIMSAMPRI